MRNRFDDEELLSTCFTGAGSSTSQRMTDEAASPDVFVGWRESAIRTKSDSAHHRGRKRIGWGREVKNPQGVEGTLWSFFQARSDRYPGPPDEGRRRRKVKETLVESGRGEGASPTIELIYLGGEEVRRASTWYRGNIPYRERTLRRMKALKSTPWLARSRCSLPNGVRREPSESRATTL
jgi:hypothetical protein